MRSLFQRLPLIVATGCVLVGSDLALEAQAVPAGRPAFAVASVKLNKNCAGSAARSKFNPISFHFPCASVRALVRIANSAYSGNEPNAGALEVIGGPSWMDSERYDIDAKPGAATSPAEMFGPMLQSLLEDRFHVKIYRQARETSAYVLTVGAPSPLLRPAKASDCVPRDPFVESKEQPAQPTEVDPTARSLCNGGRGTLNKRGPGMVFDLEAFTMAEFCARFLFGYTGRPVIDETGLKGRFDLHLEFVPTPPGGPASLNGETVELSPDDSAETSHYSIFSALRKQLGLKLTSGKAPVDVLVVDHAERPSAIESRIIE